MKTAFEIHLPQREIDRRKELLNSWAEYKNPRPPVFVFVDSPFYCKVAGIDLKDIYRDPEAMVRAQILGWKKILETIDCDNIRPNVGIDFGSCLTASMYGCELIEQPGSTPGFKTWFTSERDLDTLERIDPWGNGLHAKEIEYYERLRERSTEYTVAFDGGEPCFPLESVEISPVSEGPFSALCMIAGLDRIATWCYDNPNLVRRMMEIVTEKEIGRIRKTFEFMECPERPLSLADDFSPFVSLDMYREFILPHQMKMRDAFGDTCTFHSCIPDRKLLVDWKDSLKMTLFNGFKPLRGLASLKEYYAPIAELMLGKALMEPDWDGANMITADEATLIETAHTFIDIFGDCNGVKICFTLSGGHEVGDLEKFNVIKPTVNERKGTE